MANYDYSQIKRDTDSYWTRLRVVLKGYGPRYLTPQTVARSLDGSSLKQYAPTKRAWDLNLRVKYTDLGNGTVTYQDKYASLDYLVSLNSHPGALHFKDNTNTQYSVLMVTPEIKTQAMVPVLDATEGFYYVMIVLEEI